jgi:hypothetical protein
MFHRPKLPQMPGSAYAAAAFHANFWQQSRCGEIQPARSIKIAVEFVLFLEMRHIVINLDDERSGIAADARRRA